VVTKLLFCEIESDYQEFKFMFFIFIFSFFCPIISYMRCLPLKLLIFCLFDEMYLKMVVFEKP